MRFLRPTIIILALIQAGWFTFDGARALAVGDYVTPSSGEYAGRLGPWSQIVTAVGIEPRSTLMKGVFLIYGVVWLIVISFFAQKQSGTWTAMLIAAIGALWYLPFGTLLCLIQIVLLITLHRNQDALIDN